MKTLGVDRVCHNPEADETTRSHDDGYDDHEYQCERRILPQCPNTCSRDGSANPTHAIHTQEGWRQANSLTSPYQRSHSMVEPSHTILRGAAYTFAFALKGVTD